MNTKLALAVIATLAMAGCGGGGGASTSAPAPTPTPTPTQTVLAANLQPAAQPAYAQDSQELGAFNELASFRTTMALGPLNQDVRIDVASKNHSAYVFLNNSGATPHDEIVGNPGFTGVGPLERVVAAGYPATNASEVVAFGGRSGTSAESVRVLLATIYHRNALMWQSATSIGIAPLDDQHPTYIDLAVADKGQNVAGDYVGVYPVNGQTGVSLTHYVEAPNPFPELQSADFCTNTSYPISVMVNEMATLNVSSFTVTEAGQTTPLDGREIWSGSSYKPSKPIGAYVAYWVGRAAFKPNTTYTVKFIGSASGGVVGNAPLSISKTWTFTTAAQDMRCAS